MLLVSMAGKKLKSVWGANARKHALDKYRKQPVIIPLIIGPSMSCK